MKQLGKGCNFKFVPTPEGLRVLGIEENTDRFIHGKAVPDNRTKYGELICHVLLTENRDTARNDLEEDYSNVTGVIGVHHNNGIDTIVASNIRLTKRDHLNVGTFSRFEFTARTSSNKLLFKLKCQIA